MNRFANECRIRMLHYDENHKKNNTSNRTLQVKSTLFDTLSYENTVHSTLLSD